MTQNGESDLATGGMNQLEDPNAESYEDGLDETAAALLSEVLAGTPRGSQRSTGRRPAETPSAASSSSTAILHPRMGLPTHVLAELQQRHSVESHRELRHVETINDRSAPLIDAEVRIGESAHRALLTEIQRKASFISHFAQRIKLSSAVSAGLADARQRLRKVPNVNDRSEPLIPEGATVRKSVAPQVFAELSKSQVVLRHVENTNDRSAPRIEEGVALRHDGRSALFDELKRKAAAAAAPFLR